MASTLQEHTLNMALRKGENKKNEPPHSWQEVEKEDLGGGEGSLKVVAGCGRSFMSYNI